MTNEPDPQLLTISQLALVGSCSVDDQLPRAHELLDRPHRLGKERLEILLATDQARPDLEAEFLTPVALPDPRTVLFLAIHALDPEYGRASGIELWLDRDWNDRVPVDDQFRLSIVHNRYDPREPDLEICAFAARDNGRQLRRRCHCSAWITVREWQHLEGHAVYIDTLRRREVVVCRSA